METSAYIIGAASVIILLFAMVRHFMRTNIMCQFCGATDVKVWDRLTAGQQKAILHYFKSCERRDPDTSGIFVCDNCKTVFDDFSGEKASREVDSVTAGVGPATRVLITCKAWCKVCNNMLLSCDPDNDDIVCRTCGTHYKWKTHAESDYRFLMPPKGAQVLQRCFDVSGVA